MICLESDIINEFMIHNGKTINVYDFDYSMIKKDNGVYEVIRIIDGVPLFMEKHLARFRSSARLLGFELNETDESISKTIKKLISQNKCFNCNVKIIMNNLNSYVQDNYTFFVKSSYPSFEQVKSGVPVILYHAERSNPNAKSTALNYRDKIVREIESHNAYEALLVNRNNEITEGSKSNIFAVNKNAIYTPPAKNVLPGVTRGYVMEICESLGFSVVESQINKNWLSEMDGLFLTGTSPNVLPISWVDETEFPSAENAVIIKIRESYDTLVNDYIKSHETE